MPEVVQTPVTVQVVSPSGEAGTVPLANLDAAKAAGFTELALSQQIAAATGEAEAQKLSGPVGGLAALTAGAGDTATLGLSNLAASGLARLTEGPEGQAEIAHANQRLEDVRPGMRGLGQAAGMLIPSPVGLLGGAAGKGAQAVVGTGAAGIAARAAQGAATWSARMGAEMAAYGAGEELTEAALGNDLDAAGEKMLAGAGRGLLVGMATGGLLGGAGGAGSAAWGKLTRRLAGRAEPAAEGLAGASAAHPEPLTGAEVADRASKVPESAVSAIGETKSGLAAAANDVANLEAGAAKAGVSTGEAEAAIGEAKAAVDASGATGSAADQLALKYVTRAAKGDRAKAEALMAVWRDRELAHAKGLTRMEELTRSVSKDLDIALQKGERTIQTSAYGEAKAEQMAHLVDGTKFREAQRSAFGVVQDVRSVLEDLKARPTHGGAANLKKLEAMVEETEQKLEGNMAPSAPTRRGLENPHLGPMRAEAAPSNPQGVRDMFIAIDDLKRAVGKEAKFGKSPIGLSPAGHEFDALYHRIRPTLEDEAVWGAAGTAQREINAADTKAFGTLQNFSRDFTTQFDSEAGRPIYRANPASVQSFLSDSNLARADLRKEAAERFISGLRGRMNAVEKHLKLPAAEKANLTEARAALDRFESSLGKASQEAATIAKIQEMQKAESLHAMSAAHAVPVIGGALNLAAQANSSPLATITRMAEIKASVDKMTKALDHGIGRVVGASEKGSADVSRAIRDARVVGAQRETTEAVTRAEAARMVGVVQESAANPGGVVDKVTRALGDMHTVAPQTATAMAITASRAIAYLGTVAPKGRTNAPSLQPLAEERRYNASELDVFAERLRAIEDPLTVLDDVAAGTISRPAIEAVRAVYPKLFREIQVKVAVACAASPKPIAWERQKSLAILLGVPTDATLDPGFVARTQASFAASGANQPPASQQPQQAGASAQGGGVNRQVKVDPGVLYTPSQRIAAR